MSYTKIKSWLEGPLHKMRDSGLFKEERDITSPQESQVNTQDGPHINLWANNYLGLANHPDILKAVQEGLQTHGFGLASVRFICDTQDIHKSLEKRITKFLGTEDTILYSSFFDANGGLFVPLFDSEDAVIHDMLHHASIIDGMRICRSQRHIYNHCGMTKIRSATEGTSECAMQDDRYLWSL